MKSKNGRKAGLWDRTTFMKQKESLITGVLLTALLLLLFGIFSQLPAPRFTVTPEGATLIDYSTFLAQVREGHIVAVSMQDQDIKALLARPLPNSQVTATDRSEMTLPKAGIDSAEYYDYGFEHVPTTTSSPPVPTDLVFTRLPGRGDASLVPLLMSKHVEINVLPSAPHMSSLIWKPLTCFCLLLLLLWILFPNRRIRLPGPSNDRWRTNQLSNRARTPEAPVHDPSATDKPTQTQMSSPAHPQLEPSPITFADVAGIDEVRQEIEELVQFLRSPDRFERLGARIPRGALLVGLPGTGKTMLARAVAGEAQVPFYSVSASEFVEIYVGLGAKRVRDLFQKARETAPCVLFIDELDAVGRKRTSRLSGNDERDQTLNQLLIELDGFAARRTIVVLAATNRADILDPALLRPGRFDRHINVSLPDRSGRQAILQVHTRDMPLHGEVSLERLARLTTGMSGADLANLVNEAALGAARRDLVCITWSCLEEALARVLLGAQRPIVLSETERRIIAFHEAGHALVAYHLPKADRVNSVTILPRGQSLGVTQFVADEDRHNHSRERLMARMAVGLAGRAAEAQTFGTDRVTTGAENDFQMVTGLARNMVTRWGMSEHIGTMFVEGQAEATAAGRSLGYHASDALCALSQALVTDLAGQHVLNGGDLHTYQHPIAQGASRSSMATLIDSEVRRLLGESYQRALTILSEHQDQLNRIAQALMEHEQLDGAAFERLVRGEEATPSGADPSLSSREQAEQ